MVRNFIAYCLVVALGYIFLLHLLIFWISGKAIIYENSQVVLIVETVLSVAVIAFGFERLISIRRKKMELPEKNGKHHYITCETQFYQAHEQGIKTFEACANDHNYKVGDIVHLQEVVNGVKTGRELDGKMITYIQYGGQYGIHEDCCVFQLDRESYIKR